MSIQANFDEAKQSQLPCIELLVNLGYKYISREEVLKQRGLETNKFILKDIAFNKLREINSFEYKGEVRKFSDENIINVIDELESIPLEGIIDTSKEVYNIIMTNGGKTIKEFVGGKSESFNFRFIDFNNIENNVFHITSEYEATGKKNIRADIVLFVNGIPFVVIENKKSSIEVEEALTQINRYQTTEYCPKFFIYPQLLIGTNKSSFLYGTTLTPNKFYVNWREKEISKLELDSKIQSLITKKIDGDIYKQICNDLNGATLNHKQLTDRIISEQDKGIVCILDPKRLLDITKNNILYDGGHKKIARYQQYFAINKSLKTLEIEKESITGIKRNGGLIWHTQGSGKSLTMVMLVKALIEDPNITNPRIIIVTDRKDLNKQISDTFRACNLKKDVIEASSGRNLLKLIKEKNLNVITTLVHKFESASKIRANFQDLSKDIFVLIDEAHSSQGGIANAEMNRTIPNACYIGFTGTPLMKKEKASYLKFGQYIDKYTIDDALKDGVILPLIYEGRYTELTQNKDKIDALIERITKDLDSKQVKELQKIINTDIIKNNPHRISEIAFDIENHYTQYFQGTGLKAQIVAPSKYSAILFQKIFEESGKINTAIVISDELTDENEKDGHAKEVSQYLKLLKSKYKDLTSYEKQVIDSFKNNENGIEILIVVDKLLTGFDAPRNTVLYLAKDLKDHNLLQAIARVNRLYENKKSPKTSGFIIDYSENAKNIKIAMQLFGNFDEEDVKGTLIDVKEKIKDLEDSYDCIHEIFKELKGTKDDEAYIQKLGDEQERDGFYKAVNNFLKNFNECFALQGFVHTFAPHLDAYKRDLKKFLELRGTVRFRYADRKDFTDYKNQLTKILDEYVDAEAVEIMTKQVEITDTDAFANAVESFGSDKSKAEAIAAQMEKTITERENTDPEFYHRFSDKVRKILDKMRDGKIEDFKALGQMKILQAEMLNKKDDSIPEEIKNEKGADIFYRNLLQILIGYQINKNLISKIILAIFEILKKESIVDWYKNNEIKRIIRNAIDDYLYEEVKLKMGIMLSEEDIKRILDETLDLAIANNELFL